MKSLFVVLSLIAFHAHGLELVGNKITDTTSEYFETTLSQKFIAARTATIDQIELTGNPNFNSGSVTDVSPVVGFATTFSKAYPELFSSDVDTLRQTFAGAREIVLDDCKLGFMGVSPTTVYGVVTWGKGRGFAIVMPYNNEMESAVRETLESIKLQSNACGWE